MSFNEYEAKSASDFIAFVTSGRYVEDIGKELGLPEMSEVRGRVYGEGFYIEGCPGNWELNIENQSYGSNKYSLADMESILFDWAEADGYFE